MSKSIILENQVQESDYIPVAFETVFNNIYEPLGQEHGLDFITNIAFGYDFVHSNLLDIITHWRGSEKTRVY